MSSIGKELKSVLPKAYNLMKSVSFTHPQEYHTNLQLGFAQTTDYQDFFGFDVVENEFLIVSQSKGPYAELAVREVVATALFSYHVMKVKRFYAEAKAQLLAQLVQNVSRKLFRLQGDHPGMSAKMLVFCFSQKFWWASRIGDIRLYTYGENKMVTMFAKTSPPELQLLGHMKYVPEETAQGAFKDMSHLIAVSESMVLSLNEKRLFEAVKGVVQNDNSQKAAELLVSYAAKRRKQAGYMALVVHRKLTQPKPIVQISDPKI